LTAAPQISKATSTLPCTQKELQRITDEQPSMDDFPDFLRILGPDRGKMQEI
jgi:hypothetical protein